ncbi:polysaccharide pyruvyl transferase family protein [Helicobacter sp. MIT 05-5294]|uniref:polysaccharide pyruvyl transferase family protein n=1 Tax=Helicobacter sp. MIT 05-5294 TaxID=1548150 RepID=UPI001EE8C400|nr:polysaccharide pyruvyl transferase family protein [Helicobacter sp. MIT 05-5294]
MQGWFGYHHYFPSHETLPIFVGTHFAESIYKALEYFVAYYPYYFVFKEIGCRDLETLRFCQRLGIQAYLSRCLTLTLPKREESLSKSADKVFLVGIPDNLLEYIPQDLRQNAVRINQQSVKIEESLNPRDYEAKTRTLLETYKKEAKLIITCALHCAAPCTAFGIPVVLIARNQENINRFSAVNGILKVWSIEDLKAKRVNFNPTAPNIESLKSNMLENLNLSIQKEFGESIDETRLQVVRQAIAEFKAENLDTLDSAHFCGGGGI